MCLLIHEICVLVGGGRKDCRGKGASSLAEKKLLFETLFLMVQVYIEKQKGEILGVVIVESGWGSILPTVIIANMMHGGPAEKSGKLNIGDQIMSINGTSLVGLPLSTCQSIIKVRRMFLDLFKGLHDRRAL